MASQSMNLSYSSSLHVEQIKKVCSKISSSRYIRSERTRKFHATLKTQNAPAPAILHVCTKRFELGIIENVHHELVESGLPILHALCLVRGQRDFLAPRLPT